MEIPDGSESFKRRNKHLFHPNYDTIKAGPSYQVASANPAKRIRQSSAPLLNGIETRFKNEVLSLRYHASTRVVAQGMRVKIANGSWYKVDFYVPELSMAHEVKGPRVMKNLQSRQMLALKTAASQWPEIAWWIHWFENGQWHEQHVLA